jgi:hypothetical protein
MTDKRLSWTQPICEADWVDQRSTFAEKGWDDLVVERPTTVRTAPLEQCAWCGLPTFVGIYVRADPATVPYPRTDDDG